MAEPVDAADLKSVGRKAVGVQVPLPPSVRGFWLLAFGKWPLRRGRDPLGTVWARKTPKGSKLGTGLGTVPLAGKDFYLVRMNRVLKDLG